MEPELKKEVVHGTERDDAPPSPAPSIPDGGWGWLVVLGSFLCNAIVDGIIFSYGLFIPEFAEAFGESKGRLAWIGSIMAGFYLIIGPVVSGFANAYGCRVVTIVGTVIASASFAISSLAHNMEFLCISFGLMGGIGFGFIYLPAVVTVGFYFEKKRAFATGLAVCGSGVGTFVMAPLVKCLLQTYSWKGTLLILSGVVLHCAIFGALFKPLPSKTKEEPEVQSQPPTPMMQRIKNHRDAEKKGWESQDCLDAPVIVPTDLTCSLPEMSKLMEASGQFLNGCNNSSPAASNNNSPPPPYSEVVGEDERMTFLALENCRPCMKQKRASLPHIERRRKVAPRNDLQRPFFRKDILYSASILNLKEYASQPDIEKYRASVTTIPVLTEESKACCCCSPVVKETFRQMMDLSLLKSPTFLVLALAGFVTLAGFFVPFMFIIDRAITSGISADSATYIVPAIGITNTVGRVFSGWVSDRPQLNALTINNVALIVGGLGTIISPFLNSWTLLMLYGAVFGFSIACFATLRSIILVELLGLDKLTNAFGLLLLFQGVAAMLGSPVAGAFYDMTGSYDASFYIAGSFILVSGLLGFPLPAIARWEKRRAERKAAHSFEAIQIIVDDCDQNAEPKPESV